MGYDRGDSFPFDLEPNGIKFGSKSKRKRSPRSYPIERERKWKHGFLSVVTQYCIDLSAMTIQVDAKRMVATRTNTTRLLPP